jgi:hypothetical protein
MVIRRLRLGSDEVMFLQNVLSDFFVLGKKGYEHKRIEVEIQDYQEQVKKNKNNGKLGGRPKKTQSVISGLPDESQNNPNQEPLTINHKPNRESATVVACPPDVSQQIWNDWVALRKSKKAPITQTVLNGAIAEAKILGWTLEKFLAEWCSRGSQGLKAEWIVKPNPADKARLTVAPSNEPDPALLKIEEDAKKAAPIPLEVLARMAQIRQKA